MMYWIKLAVDLHEAAGLNLSKHDGARITGPCGLVTTRLSTSGPVGATHVGNNPIFLGNNKTSH